MSPLTRWILGQSGAIVADSDVPPAPVFGVVVSPTQGGVLDLGAIAFSSFVNTVSVIAGTYTFHYYDEINGSAPLALPNAIGAADTVIQFGVPVKNGFVQIEQEIIQVTSSNRAGASVVQRGMHGTASVGLSAQ